MTMHRISRFLVVACLLQFVAASTNTNPRQYKSFVRRAFDCHHCFSDRIQRECFQKTAQCVKRKDRGAFQEFKQGLIDTFGLSHDFLQKSNRYAVHNAHPNAVYPSSQKNGKGIVHRQVALGLGGPRRLRRLRNYADFKKLLRSKSFFKKYPTRTTFKVTFSNGTRTWTWKPKKTSNVWKSSRPKTSFSSIYCEGISALYISRKTNGQWCVGELGDVFSVGAVGLGNFLGDELQHHDGFVVDKMNTTVAVKKITQNRSTIRRFSAARHGKKQRHSRYTASAKVRFGSRKKEKDDFVRKKMEKLEKQEYWKRAFGTKKNSYKVTSTEVNPNAHVNYEVDVPFSDDYLKEFQLPSKTKNRKRKTR